MTKDNASFWSSISPAEKPGLFTLLVLVGAVLMFGIGVAVGRLLY
ncbi:hypothetical protein [Gallaecimonas sp. GXIMD4217]